MRKFVFLFVFSLVFVFLCFGAFAADDDIIGSLNGVPISTLEGVSLTAGDVLHISSQTGYTFTSSFSVPSGALLVVDEGALFSPNYISVSGKLVNNGRIISNQSFNPGADGMIRLNDSAVFEHNGRLTSATRADSTAVRINSSDVSAWFWGGEVYGYRSALNIAASGGNSNINIYDTSFRNNDSRSADYIILPSSSALQLGFGQTATLQGHTLVVSASPTVAVSSLVQSAIEWITVLCAAIIANKLLLIWILVVFVGLGIGLLKRVMYS